MARWSGLKDWPHRLLLDKPGRPVSLWLVLMISAFTSRWLRGCLMLGAGWLLHPDSPAAESLSTASARVELVLPQDAGFHYAGYYAAVWHGYFAEEGLAVELRHGGGADATVEAVLGRPAVYGVGREEVLLARLQGRRVVLVAAVLQETPQALALAPGRSGGPAALEGKRIALEAPGHSAAVALMLRQAGAGPGHAHWLDLRELAKDPEEVDAWQVDVHRVAGAALRPADHDVLMFYGDSLYTSEAELAYHADRVRAVRRAVLRGWDHVLKQADKTINELDTRRETLGLRRTMAELAYEAEALRGLIKPSVVPLGSIDPVRLREAAEALVELGLAPRLQFLENFAYQPPPLRLPRWVYVVGAALGLASFGGLVMLLFNLRLQRQVLVQTQELRHSEERARELFDHAPVAIVEQDFTAVHRWLETLRREGVSDLTQWLQDHPAEVLEQYHRVTPVEANAVALRMVGASNRTEYEAHVRQAADPGMVTAFREQLLAIWRGARAITLDLSFQRAEQAPGRALVQWTVPLVGGQPDFGRVLVAMTDVTPLHEAEARVRESEARFRNLFESAIEGVFESTPEGGLVVANPAFARMLGCDSPGQLITWSRRVGAEAIYVDGQRRQQFLTALQRSDVVFDFESEVNCINGQRKWISENVRAVRDGEGRLVRIEGFVSDISERKRFEKALGEERERLAVTLRAMTEGVITTDRAGIVQYINEAAEHLTGWAEGAAIGCQLTDVCSLCHERSGAEVRVPFESVMRGEAVVDLPKHSQLVDRQANRRLVEGRCAPIHDLDSRPVGMVLVLRDVAERSRLEAEMVRSSKLESLGVLAGGIAHDFNNLLTVMLGNVSLAQLNPVVVEAAGRWLKEAELAAMRARELTHQLLTFAKGGDPVRSAVHLGQVVREAADFALHGSRVRCEFAVSGDLWPADVDKGQIGQVVQNLVINAVQAMPDGGVVRIKLLNEAHGGDAVRAIAAGAYLRLEIADEGTGIRAENLSRIFDPYFTTKSTGSGLGLAMVYSIVRKHQGHVEVDSEVGRGTTFTILLPALPTARPAEPHAESDVGELRGRVLFLDDEESIRAMVTTLLERLGLSVVAVPEGNDVLREYVAARERGEPFDVVLMDLTIVGGMGGRETMEALRQLDPDVRAVVSSGYSSDPVLANYRAHGFRGRVAKPYRAADLAKALRRVLSDETDLAGKA